MRAWPFHTADVSLRLALAESPAGRDPVDVVDPFVPLGDRGTFSRTLLGGLVGPRGTPVLEVAVKLQSDEYPLLAETTALANPEVEAAWGREAALLDAVSRAGGGLPAALEALAREPGAAAVLPPTLFCKRRQAYFASVCPDCGHRLADVRDDRLLEDRRLPRRDRSLARFVGCPECLRRSAGTRLWTLVRDAGSGEGVGEQGDLFLAFGRLARQPGDVLPCQGCEHVPRCYPDQAGVAPDVLRCLTAVTFYESRALALPVLPLRYDECALLAGGTPLAEVAAAAGEPGRRAALARLADAVAGERAHLFAHDAAGKLGLEVLRLKLGLFAQLCRAVATLHRHTRAPHLGITPARALARLDPDPTGTPWTWRLGVRLVGLGNAVARRPAGAATPDAASAGFARPRLVDPIFAPPALRDAPLADLPGTLTPRGLAAGPEGTVVLEARLEADGFDLGLVGERDTLDVTVVQGRPPLSLALVGTPTGMAGRALGLRSAPLALAPAVRDTLAQLVGQPLARARFTVHPCLHVPADVHALGMMLLVSLLAHPGRPAPEVARAVDEVRQRLDLAARRGGDDAGLLHEQAVRLLAAEPFAKRHLMADPDAHAAAADAVPDEVWIEALLVGLRAATAIRGFSVCRSAGDFDPGHPEVKVEFLLQLVDGVLRRVDAELFGLPGRARELRAALARVAREFKVE